MSVTAGGTLIVVSLVSCIFRDDVDSLRTRMKKWLFKWVRRIPFVRAKVQREMAKAREALKSSLLKANLGEVSRSELPAEGTRQETIMKELEAFIEGEIDWKGGRVSGGLYNCSPELTELNTEVYRRFMWSNPLHPDLFPSIRKMEAEVVQWCCTLFHGGKDACGTMTSGGTESIMLAMKAYREVGYERGISFPEIVLPSTAHAAFTKAGEFFRMKVTRVPIDPQTCQVNVAAMRRAISKDTVVIVGSVPPFPHGIADPIEEIAQLAQSRKVGLHVDCCLGGFIVAFMEKAGFPIEPFDFRVKGVTSISADTHKYGYCPKGTSVVMYSSADLRRRQYFVEMNWSGGLYASAITAGSRPGCLIAATWATMLYFGVNSYVEQTKKVVETTRWIISKVRGIPGIYIMGNPKISVFAMASRDINIYNLNEEMMKRGWVLNALQFPPALHMCVTMVTTKEGVAKKFVADLKEVVAELRKKPNQPASKSAAMYGTCQAVPDRSIVQEMARMFLDLCYSSEQ